MNDILWRAVKLAQIPATKEPANPILQNGKRPAVSAVMLSIAPQRGNAVAFLNNFDSD